MKKMSSLSVFIALFISICLLTGVVQTNKVPIMLAEIWRHGARSSVYNALHQEYADKVGLGNVIGNGIRSHYLLGNEIREEYKETLFSGPNFFNTTKVFTTDTERTYLSALAHLDGLLPPGTGQQISNNLPLTKLPAYPISQAVLDTVKDTSALPYGYWVNQITRIPKQVDYMFNKNMKVACFPLYKQRAELSQEIIDTFASMTDGLAAIVAKTFPSQEYFQEPKYTPRSLSYVSDENTANFYFLGKYIQGINDEDTAYKLIWNRAAVYFSDYANEDIIRAYTNGIATSIIENFDEKIKNLKNTVPDSQSFKFLGFSTHESSMIPMLIKWKMTSVDCAIKMYKKEDLKGEQCEDIPPFASNILFELSQDSETKEIYVKATYNKDTPIKSLCAAPDATDNQYSCKYEDFKTSLNENFMWTIEERKKACTTSGGGGGKDDDSSVDLWFIVSIVLSIVILTLVLGLIFFLIAAKRIEQEVVDVDDQADNRDGYGVPQEA